MMNLLNEYELAFGVLPNEPDSNQVIYIENHKNIKLEWYIKGHLYDLKDLFFRHGLEFVYMPELIDCIDDNKLLEAAKYCIPWLKSTDLKNLREACQISIEQLYDKVKLKGNVPAVVNAKGRAFKVDVRREWEYGILFKQIAEAYAKEVEQNKPIIRYRFATQEEGSNKLSEPASSDQSESPLDDEYATANMMYVELKSMFPSWALESILASYLRKNDVTSKIVINHPRKLLLPDYNLEIVMPPATMAFYLLYLKHPEGIKFKDLVDHRDELYKLYSYTTKSGNKKAIAHTVDVMVAQIDGNQDVQRSRIKAAIRNTFRAHVCERYAQAYYLEGERGKPMKIAVASEPGKVEWKVDL